MVVKRRLSLLLGMASVRCARHLVSVIMQVMIVCLVPMRMIAMQTAAMELTAVLLGAMRAVIVQQAAGCRGRQIGCNGNCGRKPTGKHGHLSKTQRSRQLASIVVGR
jgi:hypothetical protein